MRPRRVRVRRATQVVPLTIGHNLMKHLLAHDTRASRPNVLLPVFGPGPPRGLGSARIFYADRARSPDQPIADACPGGSRPLS